MFQIWAPRANALSIDIFGGLTPCERDDSGWWTADLALLHGADYFLVVDDKQRVPDPRSSWQPHGVHGPSRYLNHSLFEWSDEHWQARPLGSAVLYELHIGTFTEDGTFDSAIDRLDHLVDLGVTHIELMPVASFQGSRGWGYDGVALYAPHETYGGPLGLKRLVDACHRRGLAVILDVVYNHLGPSGNYLPVFGPYFSERHSTPWGSAINFDGPESDEVRRFFCDNAIQWLRDYHFDGLRLDAVHAIIDTSAIPFLEQLAVEIDDLKAHLGRHLVLIAESDLNDPRIVRPPQLGGFGIDAQWSDDIHHSLHTVLTGEREGYYEDFGSLEDLSTSMQRPYVYAGRHSPHRRRIHGRPPVGLHGHQFVAYLQNHDQLGNRAKGERLCQLTNANREKIGAALILTSPYIPMLFQGEEWSAQTPFLYFVDFSDEPELARSVREGRCREFAAFGWDPAEIPDPNAIETFQRSKLPWSRLHEDQHQQMLAWYKSLIALRHRVSALTTGRLELTSAKFDAEHNWLYVERGPVRIICNFSDQTVTLPCVSDEKCVVLLASNEGCIAEEKAIRMPPETVAILGPEELRSASLQNQRLDHRGRRRASSSTSPAPVGLRHARPFKARTGNS
jgi:maltooligosyltrehalose trehalohydrolase